MRGWVARMVMLVGALAALPAAATTTNTFACTGFGPIPEGGPGGPAVWGAPLDLTCAVSAMPDRLLSINVNLNMTHTFIGDLDVVLASPGATPGGFGSMVLFSRVGAATTSSFGDSSNLSGHYTFWDAAADDIWSTAVAPACDTSCALPNLSLIHI